MLDWKILAASIVALLFISSVFVGGFGIREFLSDALGKVGNYLDSSPFDGIFSSESQEGGNRDISILLFPDEVSFSPDSVAAISSGGTELENFQGEVSLFFDESSARLTHSGLEINLPLGTLEMSGLKLASLTLEDVGFSIEPDISTDSGSILLEGFEGSATATRRGLELNGNVSRLRVEIGDLDFELA